MNLENPYNYFPHSKQEMRFKGEKIKKLKHWPNLMYFSVNIIESAFTWKCWCQKLSPFLAGFNAEV